ncbi:MAG: hypothetical protein A3F78_02770 [Burkholderiales bacterium RIFCSPLOWO2_12_FULL_61_40]|nr:MAG: hypothetical protein A3F78_02770 [Burkholderiales bacterium RIFCSPLOWO2_12_FULL_61_40]
MIRQEVLADILEATGERCPHQTALFLGGQRLSYHALNAQADQVAPGLSRGIDLLAVQVGFAKNSADTWDHSHHILS